MKSSSDTMIAFLDFIKMPVAQVAKKSGLSPQNFYDIRKGKSNITKDVAEKITKAFPEINIKFLLGLEDNMINKEFEEYNIGEAIKKIDARTKVTLSAIAELLARANGGATTVMLSELEKMVNNQLSSSE